MEVKTNSPILKERIGLFEKAYFEFTQKVKALKREQNQLINQALKELDIYKAKKMIKNIKQL